MNIINEVYVFIAKGKEGEGVIGIRGDDETWVPLVAADKARIDSLRPLAQKVCKCAGVSYVLARFHQRSDIEHFNPI